MKLGIPTLCRYDLLDELLRSAERGSLTPTGYIIIDNGGGYTRERLNGVLGARAEVAELVSPGRNLGVAASWNRMLDMAGDEPIVISNDDVQLSEHTFRNMAEGTTRAPLVGDGWYLFAQTPECTKTVGHYDENFWPAYYEDSDYEVRLQRAGFRRLPVTTEPFIHYGCATSEANPDWINDGRERNRQYFLRKWGGRMLGQDPIELFGEPWNGAPPEGWRLRAPVRAAKAVMRWDVLNAIAKKIGAARYLEIGVSTGDCMRRIDVAEKWGVDPAPHPDGVRAASIFVGKTSAEFFRINATALGRQFDLVFIDGYHDAKQVYLEVQTGLGMLRRGGVVVLHDCNPETEAMQDMSVQTGEWTGDVWKAVAHIRQAANVMGSMRVVAADYGIGILVPFVPAEPLVLDKPWEELSWSDLTQDRARLLGLVSPADWETWFDQTYAQTPAVG